MLPVCTHPVIYCPLVATVVFLRRARLPAYVSIISLTVMGVTTYRWQRLGLVKQREEQPFMDVSTRALCIILRSLTCDYLCNDVTLIVIHMHRCERKLYLHIGILHQRPFLSKNSKAYCKVASQQPSRIGGGCVSTPLGHLTITRWYV